MHVTKRTLGLAYLAATGLGLSVVLILRALYGGDPGSVETVAVLSGLIPSFSLVSLRYWLARSPLDEEGIWRVAVWGGLGIGVLTLLNTAIVFAHWMVAPILDIGALFLLSNVAAGGVAGVLLGTAREHARRTRELNEKNTVLNRVLRHDLRNAMGIVRAHAEILEEEVPASAADRLALIQRTVDETVELSETARRIEATLDRDAEARAPVDVVPLLERRLASLRASHPDARIEADLPDAAWARADDLLQSALDNVLRNAIEHNDSATPEVHVSVSTTESLTGGRVEIRVADDGPGIPAEELAVLDGTTETPLAHSSGLGLWLVKWLVDHYDGDLAFERNEPEGTVIRITLPRSRADSRRETPAGRRDEATAGEPGRPEPREARPPSASAGRGV